MWKTSELGNGLGESSPDLGYVPGPLRLAIVKWHLSIEALTWSRPMTLYAKRKSGFHNMRPERARALSRRGTQTVVELANDYAHTYAPFIQAVVGEVGHNYRQVANWLTRERIPAPCPPAN